jgi:hypothetical protein
MRRGPKRMGNLSDSEDNEGMKDHILKGEAYAGKRDKQRTKESDLGKGIMKVMEDGKRGQGQGGNKENKKDT